MWRAASAHSAPLLPTLPPARWMACSIVSQVSTPNNTGTFVSRLICVIARLTALMGQGHVGSAVLVDSWRPGAFTMADFRSQETMADVRSQIADQLQKSDVSIGIQSSNLKSAIDLQSDLCNLRSALRRFRFPVPARVVVNEGRPVRVQVERQGFSSGAILQAAGPWRTSGEWWNESAQAGPWDRDEWDVAMADGTIYRLVVERGVGQWFLEGVVD